MAPTSIHTLLSRDDDPSLGELFHHFPAELRKLFEDFVFGLFGVSIILAFLAIIFVVISVIFRIYTYGHDLLKRLTSVKMREIMEWSRERIWRSRRIEWLDKTWEWLKDGSLRRKAGAVHAEDLRRRDSYDGEGREGSIGGETLLGDEEVEDEDENGQTSEEEMELNSEDYMNGEA